MSTQTAHRIRQPQPGRLVSEASKKGLIPYISSCTSSEQSIVEGLLEEIFSCNAVPFAWGMKDLRDALPEYKDCSILCVLVSAPLTCTDEEVWAVWQTVQDFFPGTSIVWLTSEQDNAPTVPSAESSYMVVLDTELPPAQVMRKLVSVIEGIAGIPPCPITW